MTNINHKNIEEWMFDYTEGNLSAEQQKALIHFIELNPSYKEDLNSWSMAFIKAPLPQMSLDKLYLRKSFFQRHFKAWSAGLITFGIIVVLFAVWRSDEKAIKTERKITVSRKYNSDSISQSKSMDIAKATSPKFFEKKKNKEEAIIPTQNTIAPAVAEIMNTQVEISDTDNLNKDSIFKNELTTAYPTLNEDTISLKPEGNPQAVPSKMKSPKIITKKELREIEKAKLKMLQRRREAEFMKGNKPYVVPFNDGF